MSIGLAREGESGNERLRLSRARIHADSSSAASTFKLDHTSCSGEQRMVSSQIHIEAGKELGSALADDNTAGRHRLTAIGFHSQVLGVAVATVA